MALFQTQEYLERIGNTQKRMTEKGIDVLIVSDPANMNYLKGQRIMIFEAVKGQTSYGEAIGILLPDTFSPFIHGDVGNAASYPFPVRFKRIEGLTVERIFDHDLGFVEKMIAGARELEGEGVKAITGDCGFLDSDKMRQEVVGIAKELTAGHPAVRSILLECSMLTPYGKDFQQAVNLPVYDYLTMIDYVYSALVKKRLMTGYPNGQNKKAYR